MDKQNLIIFKFNFLYEVIKELEENLNFKVFKASNEKVLNNKFNNLQNYLIITQKKINNKSNQFILNQVPIKLSNLIEIINIQFLKLSFSEKSELNIGHYKMLWNNDVVEKIVKSASLTICKLSHCSRGFHCVGQQQCKGSSTSWGHSLPLASTWSTQTAHLRYRE